MQNKVLLFLATEKGYIALKRMTDKGLLNKIGAVISFKEVNVERSWDEYIKSECKRADIPFYVWNDVKLNLKKIILLNDCSYAIAISWRYLIPLCINDYLRQPLIVFHDSLLPKYRGFAPTPTAIICGETNIGVSAIFANEEVDQGDIIAQTSLYIPKTMYMKDIIHTQSEVYADMLVEIINQLYTDTITVQAQNEENATYSLWRNVDDCRIDWAKSAKEIYDFVRALGVPYPGAFTFLDDKKIKIIRTEIISGDLNFALRDVGKIWKVYNNQPEVVCGEGLLKILSAEYDNGDIVYFDKVRCRLL